MRVTSQSAEDTRLKALAELAIIETPLDPLVEQVCILASRLFDVPMAYVSLIDATHQHLMARYGIELGCMAREDAICNLTIRNDAPLVIEDTLVDQRVQHNPLVVAGPRLRFYAGIPLTIAGTRLGSFCLADTVPRRLESDQVATLQGLAELVVGQIRHHISKKELARLSLDLADKQDILARATADLEWAATHDSLTRVFNRAAITRDIEVAVKEADAFGRGVALIMIDVDNFKRVNDTLGHHAGDTVLIAIAERLIAAVGPRGRVARIGGDEFAILVSGFEAEGRIAALATDILLRLRQPVVIDGAELDARATVGIALRSPSTFGANDLFREADIALYDAKRLGRDGFAFFRPAMREALEARLSQLAVARAAVFSGRIEAYYQPKICLHTNRLLGFEALLRWHHPRLGLCGPAEMGDVFSDTEIAVAIGRGILYRVAADMTEWRRCDLDFGHVAINVAEPEFYAGDYAERIVACLKAHNLPPDLLEVEITESVFLGHHSGAVETTLTKLAEAGISIALDDFGTGYASLTHLNQHEVGTIKIDRSFVSRLETDANAAKIVEALIALANSLEISIVAEGIETSAQQAFLRERDCGIGQGYLFAKPMPASRVPYFIRTWRQTERVGAPLKAIA